MPVVACPKCKTNLKVPDGATGNVKCPKCATVLALPGTKPAAPKPAAPPPPPPAAPAFEVVDEEPAPLPPPPPPAGGEFKFDAAVGGAKSKKRSDDDEDDDDEDDKPRKKKRRDEDDEDDEDDRPRGKRRRDDDDEDDEDDKPRKKKKKKSRDEDEEDDEDDRPKGGKGGGPFAAAATGLGLVSISLWIYMGTFALMTFFVLLAWMGVVVPNGLMIVAGLLGLANWIVALVGLGFTIAGPAKARGLAIAATSVAAVHLVLCFVVSNNAKCATAFTAGIGYVAMAGQASKVEAILKKMSTETDFTKMRELEKELREISESNRDAMEDRTDMRWQDLTTALPFVDGLISQLSYHSRSFSYTILGVIAGLTEIARLVLIALLIGAVGRAAKSGEPAERGKVAMITYGVGVVIVMILLLIVTVISRESESSSKSPASSSKSSGANWLAAGLLLMYLIHLGGLFLSPFAAAIGSAAARRKAR